MSVSGLPTPSGWLAGAGRAPGGELRTDPPPDLAIEVDVSHSSLDRLGIYAALGVPEVWRLDDDRLSFYVLGGQQTYAPSAVSPPPLRGSFPLVGPADLL